MRKQKRPAYGIFWLVILYLVGQLVMSGHIEWQLTPGSIDQLVCGFVAPWPAAAAPQESFGDGPGNR